MHMKTTMELTSLFLWFCLAVIGCGGGGSDDNLGGVDGDKKLSEISTQEYQAICEDLSDRLLEELTTDRLCTAFAAAYADTESTCTTFNQTCIDNPPPQLDDLQSQLADNDSCFDGDLSSCSATVAQASSCANEIKGRLGAWIGNVTCSQAEDIDENYFEESDPFADLPEQCAPLQECGMFQD